MRHLLRDGVLMTGEYPRSDETTLAVRISGTLARRTS
jgi:hypothetical protein